MNAGRVHPLEQDHCTTCGKPKPDIAMRTGERFHSGRCWDIWVNSEYAQMLLGGPEYDRDLPQWFREGMLRELDTLTPRCAITLFCLTRDDFTRRDLAHLLHLVSEIITRRAELDEPFKEDF
jgi:hypothetical protein